MSTLDLKIHSKLLTSANQLVPGFSFTAERKEFHLPMIIFRAYAALEGSTAANELKEFSVVRYGTSLIISAKHGSSDVALLFALDSKRWVMDGVEIERPESIGLELELLACLSFLDFMNIE